MGADDRSFRRRSSRAKLRGQADRPPRWGLQMSVLPHDGPQVGPRSVGPGRGRPGDRLQRCHGPGGNHIRAIEAKLTDPAIVNPALATAEGRLRVCGQCHSNHQQSPLPRTDPFWLRFQGTTVAWSRCYTESAGSLDCMTCHDAHHDNERSAAEHNARCLTCHAAPVPAAAMARAETSKSSDRARFEGRRALSNRPKAVSGATCHQFGSSHSTPRLPITISAYTMTRSRQPRTDFHSGGTPDSEQKQVHSSHRGRRIRLVRVSFVRL